MPGKHPYQLITFDVYSALFDVESSLAPRITETIPIVPDSIGFVRAWRRKQLEYALISNSLQGKRISFEIITRRSLDDTLARAGQDVPEPARTALVETWRELVPWPETAEVLRALKKRGYTLGLLSNGDTSMLRALLKKLPHVITHAFSSQQAGYYKPHFSVYSLPLQSLDLKAGDVLHVAGSPTDVLGAKAAGLPCIWSNREQQPHLDPSYLADYEVSDLTGLLKILE